VLPQIEGIFKAIDQIIGWFAFGWSRHMRERSA
jgi:hypothetical protein